MPKALIIDDEEDVRELITFNLQAAGWETEEAENGLQGVKAAPEAKPDVIVLDIMMPEMDGFEAFKALRSEKETREIPVLFLSALGEPDDRITGLAMGAEDYLVKPFSPKELILRIENLVKQAENASDEVKSGPFHLDRKNLKFNLQGEEIDLTATEFKLLLILIENRGADQPRGELLRRIWGYDERIQTRTLDTHVKRLREKLGEFGSWIETSRGIGYRFQEPT